MLPISVNSTPDAIGFMVSFVSSSTELHFTLRLEFGDSLFWTSAGRENGSKSKIERGIVCEREIYRRRERVIETMFKFKI